MVLSEASALDLSAHIRGLTEDEIATFRRDGWVHARNFISRDLCDQVIDHFTAWTGLTREWPTDPAAQREFTAAIEKFLSRPKRGFAIRQEDPWMFNFVMQRKFGEAAARFMNVPSIKVLSETLHVKYPVSSGHSKPLAWHQDFPSMPIDRAEAMQMWLALVPMTPDMGPMVHLTGSHRTMPGGMLADSGMQEHEDARELYPDLFESYETSTPATYAAGDAVFHHSLTWHASGVNKTDRMRWAMSSVRFSGRARYTGQANVNTDGLGLTPRAHFDHPNFPTVYP